jgi:rhodanese-related sulfurtransferase
MHRSTIRRAALLLLAVAALTFAACGSTATQASVQAIGAADAVLVLDERTVIDVRTAEEFATGHVAGALNIDVEAADFDARIATLDPTAPYLVYCRSGRRSAIAGDRLVKAGFTDVVDAGSLEALRVAGAPIE